LYQMLKAPDEKLITPDVFSDHLFFNLYELILQVIIFITNL